MPYVEGLDAGDDGDPFSGWSFADEDSASFVAWRERLLELARYVSLTPESDFHTFERDWIEEDGPNAEGGFMEVWFTADGIRKPRWFRRRTSPGIAEEGSDAM